MGIYNVMSALGSVKPSSYSFPDAQFQSSYGSGVYSQPLTVRDYFSPGQLPNGANFVVTGKILQSSWGYSSPYSWTLTYGTDTTTNFTPRVSNKQFFMRAEFYSGVVRIYGVYSGDDTSFPNARVTISAISIP